MFTSWVGAGGETLSIAFAGRASTRTPGPRWYMAPCTSSHIVSSQFLAKAGVILPRPGIYLGKGPRFEINVLCDALLVERDFALGHLPPYVQCPRTMFQMGHELQFPKVSGPALLMSRSGRKPKLCPPLCIGFVSPIAKELPGTPWSESSHWATIGRIGGPNDRSIFANFFVATFGTQTFHFDSRRISPALGPGKKPERFPR